MIRWIHIYSFCLFVFSSYACVRWVCKMECGWKKTFFIFVNIQNNGCCEHIGHYMKSLLVEAYENDGWMVWIASRLIESEQKTTTNNIWIQRVGIGQWCSISFSSIGSTNNNNTFMRLWGYILLHGHSLTHSRTYKSTDGNSCENSTFVIFFSLLLVTLLLLHSKNLRFLVKIEKNAIATKQTVNKWINKKWISAVAGSAFKADKECYALCQLWALCIS